MDSEIYSYVFSAKREVIGGILNYILDIGSGDHPNPSANLFIEKNINSHQDREGRKAKIVDNLIIADGCYLPLKTNSIDKVYSRHVIEHTDDPELFISECSKVSNNNYEIIFPSMLNEISRLLIYDNYALKVHKFTYHPIEKKWIPLSELHNRRPRYTKNRELFIKILRALPRKFKFILSAYFDILDEYYQQFSIGFVDEKIKKGGT